MRKMYAIRDEYYATEYICEACIADDDEIMGIVFDMMCETCGYEDLVS